MSDHGAIDEQVRQLVRSRRVELERLVDQALERELAQLVEQRLAARSGATTPVRNERAAGDSRHVRARAAGPCR